MLSHKLVAFKTSFNIPFLERCMLTWSLTRLQAYFTEMSGYVLVVSWFEFINSFWPSWKWKWHCYYTMEISMQNMLKIKCIWNVLA